MQGAWKTSQALAPNTWSIPFFVVRRITSTRSFPAPPQLSVFHPRPRADRGHRRTPIEVKPSLHMPIGETFPPATDIYSCSRLTEVRKYSEISFPVVTQLQLESQEERNGGEPGMPISALTATESQLGRLKKDASITRPSLMEELIARGVRITAQRKLLVGIIQDASRHLDAAVCCASPGSTIRISIAPPSTARSPC